MIPRWISTLLHHENCIIHGDGETSRDFCYVENVIQSIILSSTTNNELALNQIYNIAYGERTTLNELYQMICDRLISLKINVKGLKPQYNDFRVGDVRHSLANIQKAKQLLGYIPVESVRLGLDKTVPWYISSGKYESANK